VPFLSIRCKVSALQLLVKRHSNNNLMEHQQMQSLKAMRNRCVDCEQMHGEEHDKSAGFREKDHLQICIRNPNCI